jgi:hypothetical protein
MGRFSNLKDKLADAKDAVHIKYLEAQVEREKKKEADFEKNKQKFLERTAKWAHQSGQPATLFEGGVWYMYYPDGRKEPIAPQGPTALQEPKE